MAELNAEIRTLQVPVDCGGEMFSDPDCDGNVAVVKFENESLLEWNADYSEPGMALDWFSIYADSTPATSDAGEML